ncbi:MAG: flagellar basal-body MS-ring/collar protein FliF [Maricaulaceae bacterium]
MNFFRVWLGLTINKRIMSALSVMVTIAAFLALTNIALKPKMEILYGGLEPSVAGEVITKLSGMDVAYEVRGNTIYADVSRRDVLRLELAKDGLPRQSVVGYELFDDINSFAMTSEMFDSNYWRAKQGELTRTLLTMPYIKSARVHIGVEGTDKRSGQKTASVTITGVSRLTSEQAKAIQYLTALAVAGLDPDAVSVIDSNYGVLVGPGGGSAVAEGGSGETALEAKIKRNLLSMLEARVGPGNVRINLSIDIDRVQEVKTERRFDPDGRVVKTQTSNEVTDSRSGTNGSVTVASNLPEGEGAAGTEEFDRSEVVESTTYEISEVVLSTEKQAGAIKRMTVAVLVSDLAVRAEDGSVSFTPRTEQEVTDLRELAASAVGLDPRRGDELTIKSLPFDRPAVLPLTESPSLLSQFLERYLWSFIQSVLLATTVLVLGLFVVRPMLSSSEQGGNLPGLEPMELGFDGAGGFSDAGGLPALEALPGMAGGDDMGFAGNVMSMDDYQEDPLDNLRIAAADDPAEVADVLSSWIADG